MECEQLNRLIREWYRQKLDESLAPARMMSFIDQHVRNCPVCAKDLLLADEVEKIREFIFPESKLVTPIEVEEAPGGREDDPESEETDEFVDDEDEEDEI